MLDFDMVKKHMSPLIDSILDKETDESVRAVIVMVFGWSKEKGGVCCAMKARTPEEGSVMEDLACAMIALRNEGSAEMMSELAKLGRIHLRARSAG